jgi:DNA (cytosine-5)-methyltransferase 1
LWGSSFYDVLRIIKYHRPKAFILENVAGLTTHDKGNTFRTIIKSLAKSENGVQSSLKNKNNLGYHVHWKILNASDFGVPQNRKRIFIVGFLNEKDSERFVFPEAISEKKDVGKYIEYGVKGYDISEHLQKSYLFKKADGKPELIDKATKGAVKTLCASYHKIQRLTGTFVRDPKSKTGIRLLSENECKSIMGFPKSFKIPVSRTQMYRQMGNSIAVPVVEHLAKSVLKAMEEIDD